MTIKVIPSSANAKISFSPGSREAQTIHERTPSAQSAPKNASCDQEAFIEDVDFVHRFQNSSKTRHTEQNQTRILEASALSTATEGPGHLAPRLYRSRSKSSSSDATSDDLIRPLTPTSEKETSPITSWGTRLTPMETASRQTGSYRSSIPASSASQGLPSFIFDFQTVQSPQESPSSPFPVRETNQPLAGSSSMSTAQTEDYLHPLQIDHAHLVSLLSSMRQKVCRLVPPIYHARASCYLDPSAAATNIDIVALSEFLGSILMTSCAPQRDAEIQALATKITDFRRKRHERAMDEVLEWWMGILERMEMASQPFFKLYSRSLPF